MRKIGGAPRAGVAVAVLGALAIGACSSYSGPPRTQDNICGILGERDDWGEAQADAEYKWGAPPHVVMAIIWKESSFRADARPPKDYTFFGLIPNGRVSSARGYSQAIDGTWDWYQKETGNGWADREDFEDSADFVGWYMARTRRVNGLSMTDAFSQYLAYHEGHTGYRRGSWKAKDWLKKAAGRVQSQSDMYRRQLEGCRSLLA